VRPVELSDALTWDAMRCELWPDGRDDHAEEIAAYFKGTLKEPDAVLIAEDRSHAAIGFAELSFRFDIAGIEGQRAGYVEGLYVKPEARGRNVARVLLEESRAWARRNGCIQFASDRADRVVIYRGYSSRKN